MCTHVGVMFILPLLGYESPKGRGKKCEFGFQAYGTRLDIQLVVGSDFPKCSLGCRVSLQLFRREPS